MPTLILTKAQHLTLESKLYVNDVTDRIHFAASYGAQAATNKTTIVRLNAAEVRAVYRMAIDLQEHIYEIAARYAYHKYL